MERERKVKVLSLVALIVAVLGLTVAFAAMSTTLTINGNATLDAASWDIKFANLTGPTKTGAGNVVTAPTISANGLTLGTFKISLTKPGDAVVYKFDVVNNGSINAKLSTFTKNAPVCNSSVANDKTIACQNLTYSLTYDTEGGTAVKANDTLNAGQTRHLVLKLTYNQAATQLPSGPVTIDGLGITFVYAQA